MTARRWMIRRARNASRISGASNARATRHGDRVPSRTMAGQDDTADLEAKQSAGEDLAAALHHLGWEQGAGATIWARAVSDELARLQDARERFETDTADLEAWERLHSSALLLIVSIDQVLVFERRVRRLTGDAELQKARAVFEGRVPDIEALRDIVMHLDAYAVGEGNRQTGKTLPPIAESYVSQIIWYTPGRRRPRRSRRRTDQPGHGRSCRNRTRSGGGTCPGEVPAARRGGGERCASSALRPARSRVSTRGASVADRLALCIRGGHPWPRWTPEAGRASPGWVPQVTHSLSHPASFNAKRPTRLGGRVRESASWRAPARASGPGRDLHALVLAHRELVVGVVDRHPVRSAGGAVRRQILVDIEPKRATLAATATCVGSSRSTSHLTAPSSRW
jgi:hypothetical protein